jgi:hypothetical protein
MFGGKTHMKISYGLAFCLLLLAVSQASDPAGSSLGKPVTVFLHALDEYTIHVSQAKGSPVISTTDARYALEHSELLDPTLPEVRHNDFPLIAEVKLVHKIRTNEVIRIDLCGGLGLLHDVPTSYVFRYRLPEGQRERKP